MSTETMTPDRAMAVARQAHADAQAAERALEAAVVDGTRPDVTAADLAAARDEVRLATLKVEAAQRITDQVETARVDAIQAEGHARRVKAAEEQRRAELDQQLAAIDSGQAAELADGFRHNGTPVTFPETREAFFALHPDHPEAPTMDVAS